MIKLIASDMDGTLLNSEHEIAEESVKAIRNAENSGIIFAISTGREYENVEPFLKKHNIKCHCVLMNGAEYRDENGNIIEVINIDIEIAAKIIDILNKNKISARIFTNKGVYTSDTKEEALKEMTYRAMSFNHNITMEEALESAKNQPYFTQLKYIDNIKAFLESGIQIRKFVAFHSDIKLINEMKSQIEKLTGIAVSSSFIDNIEITHVKAQKGMILEKVAQKMGIDKKEVMVLGDSFNDYSMFEVFEESVAMENAIPEIKEIAKYITDTNDNFGVAKAINRVVEENKKYK